MIVPHLPWTPSAVSTESFPNGPFEVDGLGGFQFSRLNYKSGGLDIIAACRQCNDDVKAGGPAGEKKVIRWAWAHKCNQPRGPVCEGEEDKNLFRD